MFDPIILPDDPLAFNRENPADRIDYLSTPPRQKSPFWAKGIPGKRDFGDISRRPAAICK